MALAGVFRDPDELAWLEEHLKLARAVAVCSALLFACYAVADNQISPGSLSQTWYWRVLGALICLSTLQSFVPQRVARWGIAHATLASSSIAAIVNLIFLGLIHQPIIALASQMQCLMMIAMLGPLRSLAWMVSVTIWGTFNLGLYAMGASLDHFAVCNLFLLFGIAVLLGISHTAHRNYRAIRRLQALAQTQAHMVNSSSDAIIGCDTQGRITSWNPGAQMLFDWSAVGMIGQPVSMLFTPTVTPCDTARLHRALRGELVEHFQSVWAGRDGRSHEVSVTFSPIADHAGQVTGASTIARDISAEKNAERMLHDKDAQFRTAIETTQEGFCAIDAAGRIVDVNQGYCRLSGHTREELLRLNVTDLLPLEALDTGTAHIAKVRAHGNDTCEIQHQRADGSVWPAEVSTSYSEHGGGRLFCFIKDLTERKRVEALAWHQANFDCLTALPNRALLFNRLGKECAQALRNGTPLALLFADLDGFKKVNDRYGHAAGDVVLQEVARRWLACVRAADTVARLGGDEFAIVLGGSQTSQAAGTIAQKLIDSLQAPITLPCGNRARVGASIGVALFPADAQSDDELVSKADSAMYESKRRGKNAFTLACDVRCSTL